MLSILSYVSGPSVCLPWRSACSGPLPILCVCVCVRKFFFHIFLLLFKYSCLLYPPPFQPPQPSPPPTLNPTQHPFGFVHVYFTHVPENPTHFSHIIPLDCLSSWSGVMCVLYIFWRLNPCLGYHCKYVFPYGWFPFHFVGVFFSHAETF